MFFLCVLFFRCCWLSLLCGVIRKTRFFQRVWCVPKFAELYASPSLIQVLLTVLPVVGHKGKNLSSKNAKKNILPSFKSSKWTTRPTNSQPVKSICRSTGGAKVIHWLHKGPKKTEGPCAFMHCMTGAPMNDTHEDLRFCCSYHCITCGALTSMHHM